ncbi:hypothetical protein G6F46_001215 [Rhizopus delemar]|uniref:Uncharacterized protein n=2 Tax=Rhizopus TaxID=4842 RepID=A0A9P7CUA3_9FUNG|nr:hypothetical protein G6F51_001363 [Rhizopus arrhizus]KAG1575801.1 hypothetical protein G6F50_000776 [Rhizopus delemar]KAG1621961.1 hypothetical protein G6F46_001215 [Rhizopus delemar]KAG1637072.1 hypothetical protein G6F45_000823 [Rhizopus arrhizus]
MADLLRKCEEHSIQMGYWWNPSKCVILDNQPQTTEYAIYEQALPQATAFTYLGILFNPGGHLDPEKLVQSNIFKAMSTMNVLSSIGINPSGFSKLLCSRFYAQIVRPQMEYRIAINCFNHSLLKSLEEAQDKCILHQRSSMIQGKTSRLLSSRRSTITLNPILWLPMTHEERSRCIRWRLGWLPGGAPKPCPYHPNNNLSRRHAISCLNTHRRLCMPEAIVDPMSFLLNMLPTRTFVPSSIALSWTCRWPVICSILHELDQLQHYTIIPYKTPHGQKLIE